MKPALLVALAGCGRLGFDTVGDGGPRDDGSRDGAMIDPARCSAAPRPDVSQPDRVVGDGTPASCTQAALQDALNMGGTIAFACGAAPATITLTTELVASLPTVLAGGSLITLDGLHVTRVLRISAPTATLLDLTIVNGMTQESGAGVQFDNGTLLVISSRFVGNEGPQLTNVQGGGAIDGVGAMQIYDSTFSNNRSANGGAVEMTGTLTVIESRFTGNAATGLGGFGVNGGLGGAINDSGGGDLTMCGVTAEENMAGNLGGAVHRVCNIGCSDRVMRSSFVANTAPNGGAFYEQDATFEMREVTVANNVGTESVGGFWYIGTGPIVLENVTIADNVLSNGLASGAGFSGAAGLISSSTIAGNTCNGLNCVAPALDGIGALTITATVFSNNAATTNDSPSCREPAIDGGDNVQWPMTGTICAASARAVDPMLSDLASRTGRSGAFLVATPGAASPALAATSHCPTLDQLGATRARPCAVGAIEP